MVNNCFVPGCTTGNKRIYKENKAVGEKNPSMFIAPQDPDLCEKWKKAISRNRKNKEFRKGCYVCELHFLPEDIERYYITNMPDGTVNKIERGRPALRKGAIPCIFPKKSTTNQEVIEKSEKEESESEVLGLSVKERDVDMEKIPPSNSSVLENSFHNHSSLTFTSLDELNEADVIPNKNISNNLKSIMEVLLNSENIEPSATSNDFFKYLLKNVNMIKKPNKWWSITPFEEYIICAKWTENYMADRRVIIEQDLNVKVFFKDSQMNASCGKKVECLNDVTFLLQEVDSLLLCRGIQQVSEKNCLLYFERNLRGKIKSLCEECQKTKRLQEEREKRKIDISDRNLILSNRIKNEREKNIRLTRKVTKLKEKLDYLKKNYKDSMAMAEM